MYRSVRHLTLGRSERLNPPSLSLRGQHNPVGVDTLIGPRNVFYRWDILLYTQDPYGTVSVGTKNRYNGAISSALEIETPDRSLLQILQDDKSMSRKSHRLVSFHNEQVNVALYHRLS